MHWVSREKMLQPKKDGGLGFRDLHHFNLAMLAKQVWRLIHNPDSLCGRILKAKYFPNTSILNAEVPHGASYTWRSIVQGIELFKKGMIWRVGDGESNIWSNPWLPRGSTRKVSTFQGPVILEQVHELINPTTGHWDIELVKWLFHEDDAVVILNIPIRQHREDIIAWHYDPKGQFSVKSAYKVSVDTAATEPRVLLFTIR